MSLCFPFVANIGKYGVSTNALGPRADQRVQRNLEGTFEFVDNGKSHKR